MTAVQTDAAVRFGSSGVVMVEPVIRLSASAHIACYVYEDCAPILVIEDGNVRVSLTVPDTVQVTGADVNRGLALADAVARYVTELGAHAATGDGDADRAA